MQEWPFNDPPNVAVFTSKKIVAQCEWIQYVSHDEDDGAWQFHPKDGTSEEEASIVSLKEIVRIDSTILTLADLPLGWCAWRTAQDANWKREKK